MPRLIASFSSGVGRMKPCTVLCISIYLSVVGAAQADDAPRLVSPREDHAEYSAADRRVAHLTNLSIIPTIVYLQHDTVPCDLSRKVKRHALLYPIDRVLQRVKRDVEVHSLWFPEVEVTRHESSDLRIAINPKSERFASLHFSENLKASQ
ncbi:hypothetical protein [Caballeronia pedi]|uniref:hypothetical protein n=1 Tax=Caballeronia pedi TaxID=1777141 RepID=UPI003CC69CD2